MLHCSPDISYFTGLYHYCDDMSAPIAKNLITFFRYFIIVYRTRYGVDSLAWPALSLRNHTAPLDFDQRSGYHSSVCDDEAPRAHCHRLQQVVRTVTSSTTCTSTRGGIPTSVANRVVFVNKHQLIGIRYAGRAEERESVLVRPVVTRQSSTCKRRPTVLRDDSVSDGGYRRPAPSLYLLNAAALSKPHAVMSVLRHDRERRRGEVALYVRTSLSLTTWTHSGDDRSFELMWACVNGTFIGALCHPPRSTYTSDTLQDYIERCVEELSKNFPSANILMVGDFNQLSESAVVERIGFDQLVQQPTRCINALNRVFVHSKPKRCKKGVNRPFTPTKV